MKKYEYVTHYSCLSNEFNKLDIEGYTEDVEKMLNKYGSKGWELVSVVKVPNVGESMDYDLIHYFRREL